MDLSKLNEQQKEAVINSYDKNVALVASAGSGKTTVLTKRIQYLIEEMDIDPMNIMAITFTNKAANEMKTRISKETDMTGLWIGTFHSICVTILKKFAHLLPVNKHFTILDTKDALVMLKNVIKDNEIEIENKNSYSNFMEKISGYKNKYISPKKAIETARTQGDKVCSLIYKLYYERCQKSHCLDFDDLIIYTLNLLNKEEVQEWFRRNIKYLLIDEFQDSNYTQVLLAKRMIQDNNIFVVGDHKQSIYGFRGAVPEYFENFTDTFPNSKIMYLQRNYRSTQMIVNAGNDIIKHNESKLDSNSFTENEVGEHILISECYDVEEEASFVANSISSIYNENYNEVAILYPKHSQSIAIENALIRRKIPYQVVKGTSYFEKKEIKDAIAVLKLKSNPNNETAFIRTCEQIEGLGKKTVKSIIDFKNKHDIDFLKACELSIDTSKKTGKKVMKQLKPIIHANTTSISNLLLTIYDALNIKEKYKVNDDMADKIKIENETRYDNLMELVNVANDIQYEDHCDLSDFLDKMTLLGETKETSKDCVKLMTIHSSKGLEFETVFIVGAEEGILPNSNSMVGEKLQEQRRMMYVAVTRAKKNLVVSHCSYRTSNGETIKCRYSRFLPEISKDRYIYI